MKKLSSVFSFTLALLLFLTVFSPAVSSAVSVFDRTIDPGDVPMQKKVEKAVVEAYKDWIGKTWIPVKQFTTPQVKKQAESFVRNKQGEYRVYDILQLVFGHPDKVLQNGDMLFWSGWGGLYGFTVPVDGEDVDVKKYLAGEKFVFDKNKKLVRIIPVPLKVWESGGLSDVNQGIDH